MKWTLAFLSLSLAPAFAADSLGQAEHLYADRTSLTADVKALSLYHEALSDSHAPAEVYWKAARAAWWAGTRSTTKKDQFRYFQEGMDLAHQALAKDPKSTEGHFWLGSTILSYGSAKGAFTSLRLIKQVRAEMAIVLEQNPGYLGAGADRILGILDYKIPGIVGGDRKRALAHLEKSLELNPDNPVTTFYLADYYADGGEKEKAKATLLKMRSLHPSPDFIPEYDLMKPQAKELAKKLGVSLE